MRIAYQEQQNKIKGLTPILEKIVLLSKQDKERIDELEKQIQAK